MKQGHNLAILCLLFISFTSCEYDPHGIFERDLNRNTQAPTMETVNLDLTQDKDTIELLYNRVCFHFKSSNQEIRQVIFILDDSLLGTVESGNGFFDMQYDFLYDGYHRLKIEILTKTGTGSIADSLGMEGFLFAAGEWTIKVGTTPYSNLTTTVSEGFLKLQWPKPYETVSYYIVYRYNIELGRTNACEFIDKGYVGEGGDYYVRYYNKSGQLITHGWVEIPNEIVIRFTSDKNNNYAVVWGKPKYYAAVDTIILYSYNGYDRYNVQKTADIDQTGFSIPASSFGMAMSFYLGYIPKYSNPVYTLWQTPFPRFFSPELQSMVGYPSPIFGHFSRINNSEFFYHTNKYDHGSTAYNDSIFRYSANDNRIVERFRYNPPLQGGGDYFIDPSLSPDGSRYISEVGFNNTAIYGHSRDFHDYKIVDISPYMQSSAKIPISNVGTGIIYSYSYKYLYDFENEKLLGSIQNATSMENSNISSDGKYMFLRASTSLWLYSYQEDTLVLEQDLSGLAGLAIDYFDFVANDPGKAVSWNGETKEFTLLTCPGLEIVNSFKVDEDDILDIDYSSERILSCTRTKLVVRSLSDGSVEYEIPLSYRYSVMRGYYLQGNSIYYHEGARYFLN